MSIILKTTNLCKSFNGQTAVNNISLNIERNSVYGLLGPNGAGKSTTLKMITGILRPTSGSIEFDGHAWKRSDLNHIGALIEMPPLYENLTAYENLKVRTTILGLTDKRIDEVLQIVRLTETGKKRAGQFSLGMKQRLGIAVALLNNPKLLILDEPTNGLDPIGIEELRELIRSFPAKGITVILSSHILSEVQQTADHIGIIAGGVLGYEGKLNANEWLYEHLPSPEILLYIFIAINCIAVCVILTAKFAKNMRTQLSPLFEATRQVAEQNLDFEVEHSKIKEFEDVLCSFANMKDNLKISLEKQWNAEQLQREQIAALAHDLKTPLTVIQGNIDLINETELDDEQRLYAGYITESSEQIGIYIKALIDISRTIAGYQLHLEKFDIADYMGQIKAQASSLCLTKGICLQLETGANLGTLKADKLLLERAIMNVISNALDYSPPQGTIYVTVQKTDCFLHISITDEGGGFTSEALHHAQEQFFMGDKSPFENDM